jgi:hypothetical protein
MSRRDTLRQTAYRAMVLRADGSVRMEKVARTECGVRVFYADCVLEPGESVVCQIRPPGKSRFLTQAIRRRSGPSDPSEGRDVDGASLAGVNPADCDPDPGEP